MRKVPEPEREEWIRRLRERARRDAAELVPQPGFAVYGLLTPDLGPGALAETTRVNGRWEQIGLAYGDPLLAAGPLISVTTSVPEDAPRPDQPDPQDLRVSLDQARDRMADHAGVDAEEPAAPPAFAETGLIVDGRAVRCVICRHGDLWAARTTVADPGVLVVGRGVEPGSVRLAAVPDLSPYARARSEWIGRLSERSRQRPEPVLPPADGVAAYRALVEHVLGAQDERLEARRAGRAARYRTGDGAIYHALWQRAAREQARLSGGDERRADETVTLVVNHLGHLAEQAAWFRADAALRDAAIDETLRHSVLGEDVPSAEAQRAWASYWALRPDRVLASGWLGAWSAWAEH